MLLLSASFLLGACSTKGHEEKMKTQKEAEDEFVATLTAADSSAVLTLCTQCMDLLKAKNGKAASLSLSFLPRPSASPPS